MSTQSLIPQLLRLSIQRRLFSLLERTMGEPTINPTTGKREDYLRIANKLITRYHEAKSLVEATLMDNIDASSPRFTRAVYICLVNGDPIATADDIRRAADAVDATLASGGTDDWILSGVAFEQSFEMMHEAFAVDLVKALETGFEKLAVDAEFARLKQTEAQQAENRRLYQQQHAVGLTKEDQHAIKQLVKAGLRDAVADGTTALEEATEALETIEVEVTNRQPRFLKGYSTGKRHQNEYQIARQIQSEQIRKQNQHTLPPHVKLLREQRQAAAAASTDQNKSSMELTAARQQDYAKQRRELRVRQQRLERDAIAAGVAEAGMRSTQDAAGFVNTDLDEGKQEQGIRGAKDLPPGALPPWLRGPGSAPSHDRTERDALSFGLKTSLTISEQRARLPIAQYKKLIVDTIRANSVTVLVGETGSGKTTQLTQFLCEAGFAEGGLIGCTQPRRVAATSLAERVAAEYGCRVGEEVGYTVRFLDRTSQITKIKYLTDGMLLREALSDETFGRYKVIILDEAHERSLNTDVLFGLVKAAAAKRSDLRIVVTSATLDTEKFCAYFGVAKALEIPGRTHPVEIVFSDVPVEDYVDETLMSVMNIHLTMPPGDILCFLTGQDEIETVAARLHSWASQPELADMPPLIITVIFGALPQENQSIVFDKTPKGSRKVVLATNIAETSITIDDLYYVIDCGFCKQNIFNPRTGTEQLQIVPISQQQARQRSGRAGRTGPGKCYRLYTEAQFAELPAASIPDIQRTNLINVALTLKATGVNDLLTFDFLDPPNQEALVSALEKLFHLGALDEDGVLTAMGSRMSALPLEPMQCKTLLTAIDLGCASNVLTVVSMLSTQQVFYRPRDRQEEADLRRARFTFPEGDQLALLAVYDAWIAAGCSPEWCTENFVQHRSLRDARDIRNQLERILVKRAGGQASADGFLGPEQGSRDPDLVRKALTAGYFSQCAKMSANGEYRTLSDRRPVAIHPSSCLANSRPRYVIYHELVLTTREFMRNAMMVDPRWLVELAPNFYKTPEEGQLTREAKAERLVPRLRRHEMGNDWRISKLRVSTRR